MPLRSLDGLRGRLEKIDERQIFKAAEESVFNLDRSVEVALDHINQVVGDQK